MTLLLPPTNKYQLILLPVDKLLIEFPAFQSNLAQVFWERRRNSHCCSFAEPWLLIKLEK